MLNGGWYPSTATTVGDNILNMIFVSKFKRFTLSCKRKETLQEKFGLFCLTSSQETFNTFKRKGKVRQQAKLSE